MAGFITNGKIADVRNAANIADEISQYVSLKRAGKNLVGLCPFHAEKTPSFTVSEEKQIFHCFGCGQGGNVFTFVMQYHNLNFPEAVHFLAQKHGIQLPTTRMSPRQRRQLEEKDRLLEINQEAADYFRRMLKTSPLGDTARAYLGRRQISPEVVDRFWLGYAPGGWDNLVKYLSGKGIALERTAKAGLAIPKTGGYYDRFRDRIMFPILDIQSKVVGFGGRSLDDTPPKYLNSPETPVYHKGRTLYGLHVAKEVCRESDSVFVVEGYFDLLALRSQGVDNVVATLGTALTVEQMRILKGFTRQVILVFDSDEAGMKAAERTLHLFVEEKVDARVMRLPKGNDPDSYVREAGGEQFRRMAGEALGMMEFLIASVIERHDLSPEGKMRIVETLKGPLGSLTDGVSRSIYVKHLADRLDIDESAILDQIRASVPTRRRKASSIKPGTGESRLEETVVAIMLQRPDLLPRFNTQEIVESLETPAFKAVGRMILERSGSSQVFSGADLIEESQDPETRKVITALSMREKSWDQESCAKIIGQYQAYVRKRQERVLLKRIRDAEKAHDAELLSDLLAEKQRRVHQRLNSLGE